MDNKLFAKSVLLLIFLLSFSVALSASNLVIGEESEYGHKVEMTPEILEFLESQGVDSALLQLELTPEIRSQIDAIKRDKGDEDEEGPGKKLNRLVINTLSRAQAEGYDPVFMEIGQFRWRLVYSGE